MLLAQRAPRNFPVFLPKLGLPRETGRPLHAERYALAAELSRAKRMAIKKSMHFSGIKTAFPATMLASLHSHKMVKGRV